MDHLHESTPGVVALLLDDLAPPRLGTLLRAARKHSGSTRREVARRIGTTPGDLRRYERGDTLVPPHVVAALAECYGEVLTAQLATRAPIQFDERRLVVGAESRAIELDDSDELLGRYVEIVSCLRKSPAGEPIALRADDLVALSNALGQDADHVEARIVDLLGCTPYEAHSLHSEMLRRKLVLPLVGLVAGIAMVSGSGVAPASAGAQAPDAVGHVAAAHIAAGHIAAGSVVTAVVAPSPTTVVVKPQATTPPTPAPETATAETPAPEAPAPAVPDAPEADAEAQTAAMPAPVIEPDDTPMGIPGNETVEIIAP